MTNWNVLAHNGFSGIMLPLGRKVKGGVHVSVDADTEREAIEKARELVDRAYYICTAVSPINAADRALSHKHEPEDG